MVASGDIVHQLNNSWRIAHRDQPVVSLKQKLAAPFRRLLVRMFGTQETFNSLMVQYINALQDVERQRTDVLEDALNRLESMIDASSRFQESFVARERRMETALARVGVLHAGLEDQLRQTDAGLREHLRDVDTELREYLREQLREQGQEMRTSLGTLHHAVNKLLRDTSGPGLAPAAAAPAAAGGAPAARTAAAEAAPGAAPGAAPRFGHRYVAFEDQFRGSAEATGDKQAAYVQIFEGASDVLDVGCGRGEFLALLQANGISARGVDLNDAMVGFCRDQGLDASHGDALTYLKQLPEASLGGLFAAQVVEHMQPGYLAEFIDEAFARLRPGAPIILETINPACWFAFFESYLRDITHEQPLHPETLSFLLSATGFQHVHVQYMAPYPDAHKLKKVVDLPDPATIALNFNVDKLNSLLFTYLDYALIARRP
jgi:SAM-dependent methyltransferase